MKQAECGEETASRQCWNCFKRRLVCDRTLPHCKKCTKAGKECPGYDEQKPLQWVQTGKVTSRKRKTDASPLVYTAASRNAGRPDSEDSEQTLVSCLDVAPAVCAFEDNPLHGFFPASTELTEYDWGSLDDGYEGKVLQEYAIHNACAARTFNTISSVGSRDMIERLLSMRREAKTAAMVQSIEKLLQSRGRSRAAEMIDADPLTKLEGVLRLMKMNDLPNYSYLANDTDEVVQAVRYCELDRLEYRTYKQFANIAVNTRIYPLAKRYGELVPNPAIMNFPLAALHLLPPAAHHSMVCLSVNHFIHSLPEGADKGVILANRSKVYQHRGAAIRALSEYVGKNKTRYNDYSISSIMMFLSAEVSAFNDITPFLATYIDWSSYKTLPWSIGDGTRAA
jgi:hypothetical protein